MRSLRTRRAALLAGAATVAAVALAGCSAGQIAETSLKRPSNQGVNADNSNLTVAIRNLMVRYNGTAGYAKGGTAPLQVGLYNQTLLPITVLISSKPAETATENENVVSAESIGLSGGSDATSVLPNPTGSRDAAVPEPSSSEDNIAGLTKPARITLAPEGSASFLAGDEESLLAIGLTGKLAPGGSLNLVFEFSNGAAPLIVTAPVGTPLTPAPAVSGNPDEDTEG